MAESSPESRSSSVTSCSLSSGGHVTSKNQPRLIRGHTSSQAIAIVASKYDREINRNAEEITRKEAILKQRKMSAVIKSDNLQKAVKDSLNKDEPNGAQLWATRIAHIKLLEQEVKDVDKKLSSLEVDREETERKINSKRIAHLETLQKLGFLEIIGFGDYYHQKWKSETDLKLPKSNLNLDLYENNNSKSNSSGEKSELFLTSKKLPTSRKFSPPLMANMAARIFSDSKFRSGSDPSLILSQKVSSGHGKGFNNNNENKRPHLVTSLISGHRSKSSFGAKMRDGSMEISPKMGRRNPLRMLSNAIDFRHRKRNKRPRSAEYDRVNGNPNGSAGGPDSKDSLSSAYLVLPGPATGDEHLSSNLLLQQQSEFARHSLPNLEPLEIEEAIEGSRKKPTFSYAANYATNPRTKHNRQKNLEKSATALNSNDKRDSTPEIVVTGILNESLTQPHHSKRHGGLEEKIQKARQKMQNGFHSLSSGSSSSQSLSISSSNSLQSVKPKLSSRFQSAQKLNNKILTNLTGGVKRSRTFNISDVQEELAAIGSSRTLPNKQRLRKNVSSKGSTISTDGISGSSGSFYTTSSNSFDDSSGSTASSRKSSNSSSSSSNETSSITIRASDTIRREVSQEAWDEIAAWEEFAMKFYEKQKYTSKVPPQPGKTGKPTSPRKLSPVDMTAEVIV